jgi:hypothetical protein
MSSPPSSSFGFAPSLQPLRVNAEVVVGGGELARVEVRLGREGVADLDGDLGGRHRVHGALDEDEIAGRARRRTQEAEPAPDTDLTRQRKVVDAFLAAARGGDFDALLALLDPGRHAPRRWCRRADGCLGGGPRRVGRGQHLRRARPRRTIGPHRRSRRSRVGSRRTTACRGRLHDRAREDRRDRDGRRPRTPPRARPDDPRRATDRAASWPGPAVTISGPIRRRVVGPAGPGQASGVNAVSPPVL